MAIPEAAPGGAEYQEPNKDSFIRLPKEELAGQLAVESAGYRVCAFDEISVTFEPLQDGVLRYPPVQVSVPRDPEYIQSYITMGPTDWSKL